MHIKSFYQIHKWKAKAGIRIFEKSCDQARRILRPMNQNTGKAWYKLTKRTCHLQMTLLQMTLLHPSPVCKMTSLHCHVAFVQHAESTICTIIHMKLLKTRSDGTQTSWHPQHTVSINRYKILFWSDTFFV